MVDSADLEALREAWAAANQAALDELVDALASAASPEEVYAAHARFVRATASAFSSEMADLSALMRKLAGLD